MSSLQRGETVALGVALGAGLLGLLTSVGFGPLPLAPTWVAWVLHPLMLLAGGTSGVLAVRRVQQIEDIRWQIVNQELVTQAEVDYAHREAEHQRRHAGTVYLLAPLMLGYWSAYQVESEGALTLAGSLLVTPFIGFGLGLGLELLRLRRQRLADASGLK